jgi:hypothetical protein
MATVSTKMVLDTTGFNRGIKSAESSMSKFKSMAGTAAMAGIAAGFAAAAAATVGLAAGIKNVLDIGGALSDLSSRTGVAAGELRVLQEAFKQNGLSADQVGTTINKMQRALVEAGQKGGETARAFDTLGLNLDGLRAMSSADQLQTIGNAIAALPDPAARAAAAMQIFGRSGGELLTLFSNSGALSNAARTIGLQADLLTKNANIFDRASDILNSVGAKLEGFFVGVADQVVPAIMPLLEKIDGLDFAALGQKIGSAIQFGVSALTEGKIGELVGGELKLAAITFTNSMYAGLRGVTAFVTEYFTGYLPTVFSSLLKDIQPGLNAFGNILLTGAKVAGNNLINAALTAGNIFQKTISATEYAEGIGLRLKALLMEAVNGFNRALASGIDFILLKPLSNLPGIIGDPFRAARATVQEISGSLDQISNSNYDTLKQGGDLIKGALNEAIYASEVVSKDWLGVEQSAENAAQSILDAGGISQKTIDLATQQGRELGRAFSDAVSETGNIIDASAAKKAVEQTRKEIAQAAAANEEAARARFEATKTANPLFDGDELGKKVRDQVGVITDSLQKVGGGGQFARFDSTANPELTESKKQTGLLAGIETGVKGFVTAIDRAAFAVFGDPRQEQQPRQREIDFAPQAFELTPSVDVATPQLDAIKPALDLVTPTLPTLSPLLDVATPELATLSPSLNVETPTLPALAPQLSAETPTLPALNPALAVETPALPTLNPALAVETPTLPALTPSLNAETPTLPTLSPALSVETPLLPTLTPSLNVETPTLPALTPSLDVAPAPAPPAVREPLKAQGIRPISEISSLGKEKSGIRPISEISMLGKFQSGLDSIAKITARPLPQMQSVPAAAPAALPQLAAKSPGVAFPNLANNGDLAAQHLRESKKQTSILEKIATALNSASPQLMTA